MASRTRREAHEEQGEEFTPLEDLSLLHSINSKVDEIAEHIRALSGDSLASDPGQETFKVDRRRSLDDMESALRRLMSPEPRPADDDSPQVLRDAIHEVITLRIVMHEMMQASMNVYQRGLSSIRAMTEK